MQLKLGFACAGVALATLLLLATDACSGDDSSATSPDGSTSSDGSNVESSVEAGKDSAPPKPSFCDIADGGSLQDPDSGLALYAAIPFPPENPYSDAKAVLGKILFWDEQVSSDNTVA